MNCFNCGAKLDKSDILCIRCGTPVLTEDDIALMPVDISPYIDKAQNSDTAPRSDTMRFAGDSPPGADAGTRPGVAGGPGQMGSGSGPAGGPGTAARPGQAGRTGQTARPGAAGGPGTAARPGAAARPGTAARPGAAARAGSRANPGAFDNDDTEDGMLLKKYPKKKKNSGRAVVILVTTVVCLALIGIGFYFIIQPPGEGQNGSDPSGSTPGTEQNGTGQNGTGPGIPPPPPVLTISSIVISQGGRPQTEFHASVDETIILTARIEPAGIDSDISWSSSDPDVIEIIQSDSSGAEAQLIGVNAGVADIVLVANGFEESFPVFVDNLPMDLQLENAINSDTDIWLTISWTSGRFNGQETVFERAQSSQTWTMESITLRGEVEPIFGRVGNAFTISFLDEVKMYFLFSDGLGDFSNPDGTDTEEFYWWFKTTLLEAEG